MITREMVSEKLVAYLDNQLSLNQIVSWAEQVMREGDFAPDSHIDLLVNIVNSLAGMECPPNALALTQPSDLMKQPEMRIKVIHGDAA